MRVIKQSVEYIAIPDYQQMLTLVESCGRTCYKSQKNITSDSAEKFARTIIRNGHESVLEHAVISMRLVTDRGVMAELTRHRTGVAFSVESTRYCKYNDEDIGMILPVRFEEYHDQLDKENESCQAATGEQKLKNVKYNDWLNACIQACAGYLIALNHDNKAEHAREVLPISLKTEIAITANIREWRHILKLRLSPKAHPQMRDLMAKVLKLFKEDLPVFFEDITYKKKDLQPAKVETYLLSQYGSQLTWKTWKNLGGCGLPDNTRCYDKLGPMPFWPDHTTLGDIQNACIASGRALARFAIDNLDMPIFATTEKHG